MVDVIDAPSPNFDDRGRGVDSIVLHYTGMTSGPDALARLRDAEAKVSSHYLVELDGRVYRLVAEEKRAWHAGVSSWNGESDLNARSVGIEVVNPGHEWGYTDFPDTQVQAVIALVRAIMKRHNVSRRRVLGHSDVAPERKEDPGEKFPWDRLAAEGLAIAPYTGDPDPTVPYEKALIALADIGYAAPPGAHAAAVLAFQRRFCPQALGQALNPLTKAALVAIAEEMRR
ncbi:MAG: N-acetylmuramoyl-L-alanine amidase [Pseudomonadota bacterium]